jgi:hypothetical protein
VASYIAAEAQIAKPSTIGREEDRVETAAQVGLATPKDPGPTFFQTARMSAE